MKRIVGVGIFIVGLVLAGWSLVSFSWRAANQVEIQPVTIDGSHFGLIKRINTMQGERSIIFDDAQWLTGREGEDAAIAAGRCPSDVRSDCLPNDFFIRNTSPATTTYTLAKDVRVVMQTWKMEEYGEVAPREISLAELTGLVNEGAKHWSALPYTLTVSGGLVTQISEVYVP